MLALVSQMQSEMELTAEMREDVRTIQRNVEMEARLIDDLLDLTRIVKCKMELHQEVIDVHATIHAALELFQREIDAKGLEVTLELRAKRHHAWADPARIQQVMMNLLSNAVKFTAPGGKILMSSSNDEEGRIEVDIVDDGIGIEADVLPRLFNHFEQGERKVTRGFGGLGLGLSIVRRSLTGKSHGGTLLAMSAGKDKGATLMMTLATVPMPAPEGMRAPAPRGSALNGPGVPDFAGGGSRG